MTEKERALELFMEGFNCSQSVFAAFSHRFGIDEDTAKRISAGLGGGVGRQREVCGAVSGAVMVLGSLKAAVNGDDSQGKKENYELVREFCELFRERHGGTIICREMLKIASEKKETAKPDERNAEYYAKRPCAKAVYDAAEILEEMIKKHER